MQQVVTSFVCMDHPEAVDLEIPGFFKNDCIGYIFLSFHHMLGGSVVVADV